MHIRVKLYLMQVDLPEWRYVVLGLITIIITIFSGLFDKFDSIHQTAQMRFRILKSMTFLHHIYDICYAMLWSCFFFASIHSFLTFMVGLNILLYRDTGCFIKISDSNRTDSNNWVQLHQSENVEKRETVLHVYDWIWFYG